MFFSITSPLSLIVANGQPCFPHCCIIGCTTVAVQAVQALRACTRPAMSMVEWLAIGIV